MPRPSLSSSLIFVFFGLLSDFGLILAKKCFVTSNARSVDWQAGECVLLAHAELQTVLGQFEAASCNAAAQYKLLSDFCLIWVALQFRADFGRKLFCHKQCQIF
jgi:hypothetical protein